MKPYYYLILPALVLCLASPLALAADYTAAAAAEGPPSGEFSADILQLIADKAIKINKGKRTFMELWPARQWAIMADFKPTKEVLYPFTPGQLVGVAQYKSKGTDFRGQEIKPGLYTVRYGQQPVDGNHVGTAPTRDFFLLLPAAEDQSPSPLEKEKLFEESAAAAQTSHPAILYLQPGDKDAAEPGLEHNEEHEWWIASFSNPAKAGGSPSPLAVKLIVVGQGQE